MNLDEKLIKLIDTKALEMNYHSKSILNEVSTYIKQLNFFINGTIYLNDTEIERKLDYLIGWCTITLELPLNKDLKLIRAVKYIDSLENNQPCYDNTSRLSYIPKDSSVVPNLGRLNRHGESIYYGCIYFDDKFGGRNVAFSEVNALDEDKINILKSRTVEEIKLNYIGIWDYIFRDSKPYFISDSTYEYYKKALNYMESKFMEELFMAFQLTDAFFADILSRVSSERLYAITACLSFIYLEGDRSDGILYSSVQAKGSPVIALKPMVVDEKVEHIEAECFHIIKDYGYAKYYAKKLYEGKINSNNIKWVKA